MKSKLLAVHIIELICISRRKTLKPFVVRGFITLTKMTKLFYVYGMRKLPRISTCTFVSSSEIMIVSSPVPLPVR